ncbi:PD-(D/E)XK nuclease family transposase [Candidatus Parabeggiatoa sp. HSG14]|uniref:PD-(D/E)XK nuclease family transposase n=1 Tax=Candidatus Parabeggiatoa sp. HSG14 TaxID=3055593 RepID=UPI0025A8B9B4|nr:PD-(D/E)XK nuclease family transposase [Thiotrichales bacterium HSG14]
MHLSRLDNEVIFKKAFTDKLVFTQFVKDVIGIDIKVGKIETEKRFKPKIGYIDFAYDIFAESTDNRIIIEIQRVKYDYNFDRFLHYHNMAIAELQKSANDYKIKPTIYTIVVLTSPTIIKDKEGGEIKNDILISDMNPRDLAGNVVNCYGHQLIFLNPNFKTAKTPPAIKDWFNLILESIENPENPKINLKKRAIKKAVKLIESDNITPEERRVSKIAAATEETRKLVEQYAKEEGQKEGRKEGKMEEKKENAQKMLAKGFDVETIAEITGLDAETINQLEME